MNLETAKSSGCHFLPDSFKEFMGKHWRAPAKLKIHPSSFIVEEQHTDRLRCTINTESDIGPGHLFGGGDMGTGHMVSVTMVKKRHTTVTAIEQVYQMLGCDRERVRISYAGLKDRWAITAQRIVIEGLPIDDIIRAIMPDEKQLDDPGVFLKDPLFCNRRLGKGHLVGNNFDIRVSVPTMSAEALEGYLPPRLGHLMQNGRPHFPNFFGRQRLGKRQNLFGVGYDFIVHGAEAGIRRFFTETSPNEKPEASAVRLKLLEEWEAAERKGPVCQQVLHLEAMKQILEDHGYGDPPAYKAFNMTIEYKVVKALLRRLDYVRAMQDLDDDFSLWTGAYQGFWFNQVLGKVLSGELTLENHSDLDSRIPLYMDDPKAQRFYERYAPEAVLSKVDKNVRQLFMLPKHRHDRGPRRPLYVPVDGLSYTCEKGWVNMKFFLPKGSYATTFLGFLYALPEDEQSPDAEVLLA